MPNFRLLGVIVILMTVFGVVASFTGSRNVGAQIIDSASLPDWGAAPELNNAAWLNTDKPLHLAALRGQVVLLQFWTFGCINCQRTLPYMQAWHTQYQDEGLVVIGNHYPEYSYERDIQNVAAALQERGITYPIAQDNPGETWLAYNNLYWPTFVLIDKQGHIRYRSYGEGNYDTLENAFKALLAEDLPADSDPVETDEAYLSPLQPVTVYLEPSLDGQTLGEIRENMAFVVLEVHDGWYQIAYNDREGYVVANPEQLVFVADDDAAQ